MLKAKDGKATSYLLGEDKTTNKSLEELGKTFDQRLASRLLQACEVVKLTGGDKRKKDGTRIGTNFPEIV